MGYCVSIFTESPQIYDRLRSVSAYPIYHRTHATGLTVLWMEVGKDADYMRFSNAATTKNAIRDVYRVYGMHTRRGS